VRCRSGKRMIWWAVCKTGQMCSNLTLRVILAPPPRIASPNWNFPKECYNPFRNIKVSFQILLASIIQYSLELEQAKMVSSCHPLTSHCKKSFMLIRGSTLGPHLVDNVQICLHRILLNSDVLIVPTIYLNSLCCLYCHKNIIQLIVIEKLSCALFILLSFGGAQLPYMRSSLTE
jgi:hypothetical protein